MSHTINGDRMRQLRLALGATQTDISEIFEIESNTLISRLENGRGQVDGDIAERIARRLKCTPEFLATAPAEFVSTKPWLRAYADASVKRVDSIVADNHLAAEVLNEVRVQRIAETIPRFRDNLDDLNDHEAIEEHAQVVRSAARIEDGDVVSNVMRASERLGCVILPLPDELGRHLGLSQYVDNVPHVRVSRPRPNVPGDRQRFTVAHELGHLALHAHLPPPDTAEDARRIEQQAHRFAGAFLAPRDALLEDLHEFDPNGRVTLAALQHLKGTWGVAIKMLVVRFRQLGVLEDAQATSLYKQISKRGWNSGEPVHVGHEQPIWLARALAKRWKMEVAAEAAGNCVGVGPEHLNRWLEWGEVIEVGASDAEILPFNVRRVTGERLPSREMVSPAIDLGHDADITPLSPRQK